MSIVPAATMLVCLQCSQQVTTLRLAEGGITQGLPCGHLSGFKSVPASIGSSGKAA